MDFKKILILSAGVFIIVAGLFYFFVMPKEEVGPITAEAQQLVEENKKEDALVLLLENKETLDSSGVSLINELQAELYPQYVEEAQKATDNEDFILAYETYQVLMNLAPEKDLPTIEKNLRELEKIVNEIKELEQTYMSYLETFEVALNESNELLKEFKSALDKYEIGVYKTADFKTQFTNKIDESNTILNTLDTGLQTNNQDLLSIHKEMVNLVNEQHNMVLASLQIKDEDKNSSIQTFKNTYLSIKEEQISIIQSLQDFALTNNLKSNVLSETGKVEEKPSEDPEPSTEENRETNSEEQNEQTTEKVTEPAEQNTAEQQAADSEN